MKRSFYLIVCFLIIRNLLFSQPTNSYINPQIDNILTTVVENVEYVGTVYLHHSVYVFCRTKDSLSVTSYDASDNGEINNVYRISVNDDTSFTNAVNRLYHKVRQLHTYEPYSKRAVSSGNFLLSFKESNVMQVFNKAMAIQSELEDIKLISEDIDLYMIIPYGGPNGRIELLNIKDWNGLLGYFRNIGRGGEIVR